MPVGRAAARRGRRRRGRRRAAEVDLDGVVRRAGGQRGALLRVDHVVRRRHDGPQAADAVERVVEGVQGRTSATGRRRLTTPPAAGDRPDVALSAEAEVRGVGGARSARPKPHGHAGPDADPDLAERALQDVRAVAGDPSSCAGSAPRSRAGPRPRRCSRRSTSGGRRSCSRCGGCGRDRRPGRGRVLEEVGADHVQAWRAAARRRRGFSLSRGRPWRAARRCAGTERRCGRPRCSRASARRRRWRSPRLRGGGYEQRDEREQAAE